MNPPESHRLVQLHPRPVARPWGGPGVPSLGLGVDGNPPVGEWWVPTERFGPLVKIIDAHQNLSIQLHPDDAVAASLGHPSGKTEAWYILAAQPGARILVGLLPGKDPKAFLDAADRGEDISAWLEAFDARPGDVIFVPPGTIHAICAGVTLLEVQQDADVTFRVFDWNRKPRRELHLQSCRRAITRDDRAGIVPVAHAHGQDNPAWRVRVDCPYFRLFDRVISAPAVLPPTKDDDPELLFCARGHGAVVSEGVRLQLEPGVFLLRPPGAAATQVQPADGEELLLLRTLR